jgi:hypothetical protein
METVVTRPTRPLQVLNFLSPGLRAHHIDYIFRLMKRCFLMKKEVNPEPCIVNSNQRELLCPDCFLVAIRSPGDQLHFVALPRNHFQTAERPPIIQKSGQLMISE